MTPESATVLVFDPTTAVADRVRRSLDGQSHSSVRTVSTLDDARELADSTEADCVVINLDSVADQECRSFVAGMRPDCPVVLLTESERELVDDDLLTRNTTLVERAEDADSWGFLLEKIQPYLHTDPTTDLDEEMYRRLVESARDGLYRLDANGHLVYANDSWAEMLGYERTEMIGSHASLAMAEGELERGQQVIQTVLEDDDRESDIIDIEMITNTGERITVAVHFVVLTTETGVYDGVMGVARDVTERRRDKQELQQKNERLDEFTSVVSHDLRNPLNVAQGRLELLDEEVDSEHIEPIDRALTRMDDLIENLLTLAREGQAVTDLESVDIRSLVDGCWQNVETAEATLTVETDQSIAADRTRLQQLFENLLRNAVEHGSTSPASQAQQDTGSNASESSVADAPEDAVEHGNAELTVRVGSLEDGFYLEDDGPGIPPADRNTVFDSGYSTSPDGTGFGLDIVAQIVEAHGWQIRVTDGIDGGARFEITGVEFAG